MTLREPLTAPIDYTAVLADLEAKRGQIDAAIAVIRSLIGSTVTAEGVSLPISGQSGDDAAVASPAPPQPRPRSAATATLETDTFFRLNTSDSIRKFLGIVKRPQSAKAIADALRAGGQVHATDEKTAYTNAYNALKRNDDFAQTRNKEWGLAEWYGNRSKESAE